LNSELEKKKRDIIDLSERIRLMEIDIKNRRESSNKTTAKNAPF
jgi:flagellar motility protein MotE (MotC chaperone)